MSTHFPHNREKSKCDDCHQKEIILQEQPGAMRCPIPLLAVGPSQSSSGNSRRDICMGSKSELNSHVLSRHLHTAPLLWEKGVHLVHNLHPRQKKRTFLAVQVPQIFGFAKPCGSLQFSVSFKLIRTWDFFCFRNCEGLKDETHCLCLHSAWGSEVHPHVWILLPLEADAVIEQCGGEMRCGFQEDLST